MARCLAAQEPLPPHLLRVHGVRSVRESSPSRRVVLLREALTEDAMPADLRSAVERVRGEISSYDVRLGYEELGMQEVLRALLPAGVAVPTGYEEVGHVVHLNLRPEQREHRFLIGQVMLDKLSPRIRTVANKAEARISAEEQELRMKVEMLQEQIKRLTPRGHEA